MFATEYHRIMMLLSKKLVVSVHAQNQSNLEDCVVPPIECRYVFKMHMQYILACMFASAPCLPICR